LARLSRYADQQLAEQIGRVWSAEFVDDRFVIRLEGDELREAKSAVPSIAPNTCHLLLLTEAGQYRVLILTGKPVGVRMRDWLTTEVLPSIHRTGTYTLPGAGGPPSAATVAR